MNALRIFVLLCASLVVGCIVGNDFIVDELFSCTDNQDCIGTNVCNNGICEQVDPNKDPECPDEDGDGFGVGEDRQFCTLCADEGTEEACAEDPDDNNALVYPNAPDLCDGVDNDNDGSTDNFAATCISVSDCFDIIPESGDLSLPVGTAPVCDDGLCVIKMKNRICNAGETCPCNADPLPCENGTYAAVPDECQ